MKESLKLFFVSLVIAGSIIAILRWPLGDEGHTGEPITFYCAAGMKPPVAMAISDYYEEIGVVVRVDYAGSGALLSRIRANPTGDLYLAADESYIELARKEGLIAETIPIANMRPVIAVPAGNPKNLRTIDDLVRADLKVALANPDAASIGKQTKKMLAATGQWDALAASAKVYKPTVNDVANDIKIGAVDAGIVWDATANQYPELEAINVPVFDDNAFQVTIAVLSSTEQPTDALHFARFLQARDRGGEHFRELGYEAVEGDVWSPKPELVFYSGGVNRLAIDERLNEFEKREGVAITRKYEGCGILCADMKAMAGKPLFPDAYFSCDVSFMVDVQDLFLESVDVAETDMVILAKKGNPLGITGLADLAKDGLKLGVANPKQSALGALTEKLLQRKGLYATVWPNVVKTQPKADLLVTAMQVGALDAAIVYYANTPNVRDELEIIRIDDPTAMATQPIAISRASDNKYLTQRLFDFIFEDVSKKRFEDVGFRWLHAE